jgi:hypothetical protein
VSLYRGGEAEVEVMVMVKVVSCVRGRWSREWRLGAEAVVVVVKMVVFAEAVGIVGGMWPVAVQMIGLRSVAVQRRKRR